MSLLGLASAMGVPSTALSKLLAGDASLPVAARLGTMSFSVQAFVDGEARLGMAQAMGLSTATAQELRSGVSRDVAIGIIVGLCIARPHETKSDAGRRSASDGPAGDLSSPADSPS